MQLKVSLILAPITVAMSLALVFVNCGDPVKICNFGAIPLHNQMNWPNFPSVFPMPSEEPEKLAGATSAREVKECQQKWANYLSTNVETISKTGLSFVLIPPGSFAMGSPASEVGRRNSESVQQITIANPFIITKTEITQLQYFKERRLRPSDFQQGSDFKESTESFPVESVSLYDAIEYCNHLSKTEDLAPYYRIAHAKFDKDDSIVSATVRCEGGVGYRLPTEAEWEYACRAGTVTAYYCGGSITHLDANYDETEGGQFEEPSKTTLGRPAHVGSYPPNQFGLHDMIGNVAEWCQNRYLAIYSDEVKVELDGEPVVCVARGGDFLSFPAEARSASRFKKEAGSTSALIGFRIVRTLKLIEQKR